MSSQIRYKARKPALDRHYLGRFIAYRSAKQKSYAPKF
jgi:hypothetical protein